MSSLNLEDKIETLQEQYSVVVKQLSDATIMKHKLEGAIEITQAMISERDTHAKESKKTNNKKAKVNDA